MPVEYGEPLTERELEMVALVAEGLTNREIAAQVYTDGRQQEAKSGPCHQPEQ